MTTSSLHEGRYARFTLKTLLIAVAVVPPIVYLAYRIVTETEWLVQLYSVARE